MIPYYISNRLNTIYSKTGDDNGIAEFIKHHFKALSNRFKLNKTTDINSISANGEVLVMGPGVVLLTIRDQITLGARNNENK